MRQIDTVVHRKVTRKKLVKIMKSWAKEQVANVKPMGRLVRPYKSEGEDLHWHITGLQKGMGTVEVTYSPSTMTLTVLVHDNREGFWAGHAYKNLAKEIQKLED